MRMQRDENAEGVRMQREFGGNADEKSAGKWHSRFTIPKLASKLKKTADWFTGVFYSVARY